jgi:branched-chain amino acid transport system permease protein
MTPKHVAVVVAGAMLAIGGLVLPDIASPYIVRLIIFSMLYALLALALNLSLGFRGELSLGHQTFFGIGAYTAAIMSTSFGLALLPLIPIAGVISGLAGLAIGLVALRLRGPYFSIVTLSFGVIALVLASNMVELTNGQMGISNIGTSPIAWLGWQSSWPTEVLCFEILLVLLFAASWITYALRESKIGLAWRALQDHEDLAATIGIRPLPVDLMALVIGAVICGAAGAVYAFYTSVVAPDDVFSFSIVITMLVAVVIGGRGGIIGPILGAFIFAFAPEYLRVAQGWRLPIFGLVLVLLVVLAPQGLIPLARVYLGKLIASLSSAVRSTGSAAR